MTRVITCNGYIFTRGNDTGEKTTSEKVPYDIWQVTGVTEHLGGIKATERLVSLCGLTAGQRVLDIGCGTGYSACLLAKQYGANVVAVDMNDRLLREARQRAARNDVERKIDLVRADAHNLPFKAGVFDVVMAESVLVFCDKDKVAAEAFRTLRRGGSFGDNEMTLLKPDEDMKHFLGSLMGVQALSEGGWKAVYEKAGFQNVRSGIYHIRMAEQFRGHIMADGLVKYLQGMVKGLLNPTIMAPFLRWKVLRMALRYRSILGYGLYASRKP